MKEIRSSWTRRAVLLFLSFKVEVLGEVGSVDKELVRCTVKRELMGGNQEGQTKLLECWKPSTKKRVEEN